MSPCTPPTNAVTSMLHRSPSRSTVESGMPWQTTSFTDVHSDLGNPRYPSVDG